MKNNIEKTFKETIDEWIKSNEGHAYIKYIEKKYNIKKNRFKCFEKYIETHDFDKLIYRLILEHDENWREKCYEKGYETYPNNKLQFVFDYITDNIKPIKTKKLKCCFPNIIYEYNGYYFQIIYGQGAIFRIYNKEDLRLLLQV